jgi:hypothetical protein
VNSKEETLKTFVPITSKNSTYSLINNCVALSLKEKAALAVYQQCLKRTQKKFIVTTYGIKRLTMFYDKTSIVCWVGSGGAYLLCVRLLPQLRQRIRPPLSVHFRSQDGTEQNRTEQNQLLLVF